MVRREFETDDGAPIITNDDYRIDRVEAHMSQFSAPFLNHCGIEYVHMWKTDNNVHIIQVNVHE